MAKPTIYVTKSDGESVPFSAKKLLDSLHRAGANDDTANHVLDQITGRLHPGISTKEIYRMAFSLLKSDARHLAARYNLKRAIRELGPEGFAFEKFIGAVMAHWGYEVKVGTIEEGRCVRHEVDVTAKKGNEVHFIECKFRHSETMNCDVKVPLYIRSRFEDISASYSQKPANRKLQLFGWVVTNTRFTSDATKYSECVGLRLMSWNYPKDGSLRALTDKFQLYPVTCLTSLTRQEKLSLLENDTILCLELRGKPGKLERLGIKPPRLQAVLSEVEQLCDGHLQLAVSRRGKPDKIALRQKFPSDRRYNKMRA